MTAVPGKELQYHKAGRHDWYSWVGGSGHLGMTPVPGKELQYQKAGKHECHT
jgi:hypothetical protein